MNTETESAIGPTGMTEGRRKGLSQGALICAIGGSWGMIWAPGFRPTVASFAAIAAVAVALVAWAVVWFRAGRRLAYSAEDLQRFKPLRKWYFLDSAAEWTLCCVAVILLPLWGRYDLLPQAIGLIVGLHFLPLGKLFHVPMYYTTGGVMVAAELASLLMAPSNIRSIVGCVALGLPMWLAAVFILLRLSAAGRRRVAATA